MPVLQYGSIGPMVAFSQLGLKRAGYLEPDPDGIFGKQTQRAVREFQSSAGLRQSVRNPITQGWYPNGASTATGVAASKAPTYPVHALPNPSIKLE